MPCFKINAKNLDLDYHIDPSIDLDLESAQHLHPNLKVVILISRVDSLFKKTISIRTITANDASLLFAQLYFNYFY